MFKKQILESYVKYLDLLKMEQDQNSLHVSEDISSPLPCDSGAGG